MQSVIKISKMSGKLDGLRAISTNTLTNPFCIKMNASKKEDNICTKCYSVAMLNGLRKNCAPAWQHNSDMLSGGIIPDHMLPTILDAFFRFSAHGELINATHLENLHNITLHNPHCSFALWTKRKDIVRKFYSQRESQRTLFLFIATRPSIALCNPRLNSLTARSTMWKSTLKELNRIARGKNAVIVCFAILSATGFKPLSRR